MTAVFVISHYALIGLLALICYVIGRRITMAMTFNSIAEEISVCTAMGLGSLATLAFFLGVVGWLYAPLVLALVALILIVPCAPIWRELARRIRSSLQASSNGRSAIARILPLVLIAVAVAFAWQWLYGFFALPLYPPTHFDATMYHLPFARSFAQSHRIAFLPHMRFPVFPQLNETLFSLMLLFSDDIAAQLVQFLMMLLVAVTVIAWAIRLGSPRIGLWAAGLWIASPLVLWLGASAFVDVGLTLFTVLGVYAFWVWSQDHGHGWLACSGAFCGFAAGTKYLAVIMIAVLGVSVVVLAWRRRRYAAPLVFTAMTCLVAAPWYARIVHYTGNPVFPFCAPTFGDSPWDLSSMKKPDAAAKVVVAEHRAGETIQKTTLASKISTVSSGGYLILRGLWWRIADVPALLMLPWNLAHDREQFHGLPPITAAFIVGFPLFMLVGVTRLKTRVPLALAAGYTLLWFTMARDTRYLLPVLPLYGLAIGESLDRLLLALPLSPRITRHWIIAVAGFIAFSYTGWRYSSATARTLGVIPTDAEERDVFINDHVAQSAPLNVTDLDSSLRPAYLSRHFAKHQSSYPAYQLLNKRKGSNYTLYGLYDENMAYFAQGKFIGDWTGPARYANLQHNLTDGKTLYQFLKGYNVTHFLVGMHRVPLLLPQDDFFRDHFRPIYDREVALYELIDEQDIHRVERELLKNGGFEQMGADGKPVGWQASGSPAIDSTAEHVRAGQGAMSARGSQNAFLQTVGVKPLTAYRYRFQARAEREDQAVRMQLHWSDAKGELLHYDIRALKAGTQWKTYDVTTVAPEGAAYVTIFASPHGDSTIWFDEVSFAEVQYETATTQASR